jgi:hypothetical protein
MLTDAQNWLIALLAPEIALLVGGVVGTLFTIEAIFRFKVWIRRR